MPRLSSLALARATLDRATERRRDPDWVAALWADPRARAVPVLAGKVPVSDDLTSLVYVGPAVLDSLAVVGAGAGTPDDPAGGADPAASAGERYFLGLDSDDVPYFAVALAGDPGDPDLDALLGGPAAVKVGWAGLREVGGTLPDRDAGVVVHAVALVNWHAAHQHCARCGARTRPTDGGHVRRCPDCETQHFPRTDPAIIVLVTDADDRCLLGRQGSWPVGRFSTLAGFVEPGEPLEHAVAREVHEETGIDVVDAEYAGSQPWPFPSSLMLGFFARAISTDIKVDEEEIVEARWLSRADLRAAVESGDLLLPGEVSIARRLIETWYGSPLSGSW
ncbi:NAD(+) diphosphatase [Actinopolymorpha cephalotaxi]|uniref:NAD(+) diphosphatase n=1 Tax=Actinopolymorpha cephalotaxi TaxID=504797 RepID=A0ABX2RY66_9ACTN|nr:NAD(+) diphosphatase [Actinopolymorpha cephalotaxi]NYH81808.1 NAD+ diphosphatase [Actinopolymorpha cephalotaxi]